MHEHDYKEIQPQNSMIQKVNLIVLCLRLWNGISKKLLFNPIHYIFIIAVIFTADYVIATWDKLPIFYIFKRPLLIKIFDKSIDILIAVDILIIIISTLLCVWYLSSIATNFRSWFIDSRIRIGCRNAGFKLDTNFPRLIYYKRGREKGVKMLVFYSLGVNIEKWREHFKTILAPTKYHLVREIEHGGFRGNNPLIIRLYVKRGAESTERKSPSDPLFK